MDMTYTENRWHSHPEKEVFIIIFEKEMYFCNFAKEKPHCLL